MDLTALTKKLTIEINCPFLSLEAKRSTDVSRIVRQQVYFFCHHDSAFTYGLTTFRDLLASTTTVLITENPKRALLYLQVSAIVRLRISIA